MADDDVEEEFDPVEGDLDDEIGDEFDDIDEIDGIDDAGLVDDDDDDAVVVEDTEGEDDPVVPARRKRSDEDDEDDDDETDPDDVEADLDTILKDRIASGDDLEEDEEEDAPDRSDPDSADGVTAKKEGEFTCQMCYFIVHPRQFGRKGHLSCPEGYDQCPSIAIVEKMLR